MAFDRANHMGISQKTTEAIKASFFSGPARPGVASVRFCVSDHACGLSCRRRLLSRRQGAAGRGRTCGRQLAVVGEGAAEEGCASSAPRLHNACACACPPADGHRGGGQLGPRAADRRQRHGHQGAGGARQDPKGEGLTEFLARPRHLPPWRGAATASAHAAHGGALLLLAWRGKATPSANKFVECGVWRVACKQPFFWIAGFLAARQGGGRGGKGGQARHGHHLPGQRQEAAAQGAGAGEGSRMGGR